MSDEHEADFSLVMPFVVVASKGGPFDDNTYAAGWECGQLDTELDMLKRFGANSFARTVRTDNLPQVDLIAMRHGFETAPYMAEDYEPVEGWTELVFFHHDTLEADDD